MVPDLGHTFVKLISFEIFRIMVTLTASASLNSDNSITMCQEEICEKLIQLSFVKIVSSKSERGGARLRKNLLILHLLQRARLEQRNR